MQIKTEDLKKALDTIKPGMDKDQFVFFNGEYLIAGNDQIIVYCPFNTEFTGGVNYNDLNKLVNSISVPEITVVSQNNKLLIGANNIASGLKMTDANQEIPFSLPEGCEWEKLPNDFKEALSLCSFSASTDQSMGLLTCLKIDKKNVISSDNFRVSKYTFTKPVKNTYIITLSAVNNLLRFNPINVRVDNSFVHFESDNGAIFSCRKAKGDYPKVSDLFKVDGKTFELPKELRTAVKSVDFLADNENPFERFVTVETVDGKLRCGAENDRGWSYFDIDQMDSVVKFRINPVFLFDILDKVTVITLGTDKALFERDKFIHVMTLPE